MQQRASTLRGRNWEGRCRKELRRQRGVTSASGKKHRAAAGANEKIEQEKTRKTEEGERLDLWNAQAEWQGLPVPVFLLGTSAAPVCEELLCRPCAVRRLAAPEELLPALREVLTREPAVPYVVTVGGFWGEDIPEPAALSKTAAAAAGTPVNAVSFRWMEDQGTPLAAEMTVRTPGGPKTLYVVSAVPARARRVLEYLGSLEASASLADKGRAQQSAAPVPDKPPPVNPFAFGVSVVRPSEPSPPRAKKRKRKRDAAGWAPLPPVERVKRRKAFQAATAAVLALAGAAFLFAAGFLINYATEAPRQRAKAKELAGLYHQSEPSGAAEGQSKPAAAPQTPDGNGGQLSKFSALYSRNSDLTGWLSIPAVGVDLPVMKGGDNDFYLDHNEDKKYSRYGALFLDSSNIVLPLQTGSNLAIYGHNCRNGAMFGRLAKYRDLSFYLKNPTFSFDTIYEEHNWVIFAVFITNSDPAQDNGHFFEWRLERQTAGANIDSFAAEVRQRSLFFTPVDLRPGDRVLSLTTCAYDFREARLVVMARQIREGEEIDVSTAARNPSPLYPAAMR
ncbi:MAG: class B sortase [Oscillospiraceae bacterium]|jgi:sortase B|nr:class B sortase [Oscillospiraceae bacterium]